MLKPLALLLPAVFAAHAQNYIISTIAGGTPTPGQPAANYGFASVVGLAVDPSNNLYVASLCQVVAINPAGIVIQVIGTGSCGFGGDNGPAAAAQLNNVAGVAVDPGGSIYISDGINSRVRKVAGGIITTIVGNGNSGYNGDNISAVSAELTALAGLAVDSGGNLYIADGSRIRKVSSGIISTVAGPASALLPSPGAMAVDSAGNLYVIDLTKNWVVELSSGSLRVVAGSGASGSIGDNGPALAATFDEPGAIAVDSAGNLYIADTNNNRIRKVANGIITTVVGNGSFGYNGDGQNPLSVELANPAGVAADDAGDLYFAESGNLRVRELSKSGVTTLLRDDGALAVNGQFSSTDGISVDTHGNVFVADYGDGRIWEVDAATGILTTIAGNGTGSTNANNVPPTLADITTGYAVAVAANGDIYVAEDGEDSLAARLYKISGGTVTALATLGYSPGPAMTLDQNGGVFVTNFCNVLEFSAGHSGQVASGLCKDPVVDVLGGIAVDRFGTIYVSDQDNNQIRQVQTDGTVSVLPISGLSEPAGLAVDFAGNLYVADSGNNRVLEIFQNVVTILAGTGVAGYNGDNISALSAQLNEPRGVALDYAGNIYIADDGNRRIRKLTLTGPPSVHIDSPSAGAIVTGTVTVSGWALDSINAVGTAISGVQIKVDGAPAGNAVYGINRADVCAAYPERPGCPNVGFSFQLNTATLTPGLHTINAVAADQDSIPDMSSASVTVEVVAPPSANNVLITGQVNVNGAGLSGVTIDVNGAQTLSAVTDAFGSYAVTVAKNATYTLSAALAGYAFSGPVTLSNVNSNQTATFIATAIAGLQFYPVTPCRLVDTRVNSFPSGFGPPSLNANLARTFNIPSNAACGIPASAMAYSLNVTAVTHGYLGLLSLWPAGQPIPNVSTLNSYSTSSTAMANAAIVPAGTNGGINVQASNATDLVIDINGYFAPPASAGYVFYPVTPCRLADTRLNSFPSGFGTPSLTAGNPRTFLIPTNTKCGIPSTAAAYALNVTAVPQKTLGILSIYPSGQPIPNVSTLNVYTPGTVVANAAIVSAGIGGGINVYASDATDVVLDINGYFAPAAVNGLKFYPATPCRLADTRAGAGFTGPFGAPSVSAGSPRSFPIPSSTCGIPSGAGAYSLNFTAVPQAPQLGVFIVWPSGQLQPNVSTMNSYNGSVVSNAAVVPAGSNGAISIYVTDPTDVLFDINGYFAP